MPTHLVIHEVYLRLAPQVESNPVLTRLLARIFMHAAIASLQVPVSIP
jgi:hypothetical protein